MLLPWTSPVKTFIHPTNKSCIPIQISKYFSKQEITINPLIKYSLHNETLRTRLEYLKTRNMELPSLPEFSRAPRSDTTDYGSPTWMPDGSLGTKVGKYMFQASEKIQVHHICMTCFHYDIKEK